MPRDFLRERLIDFPCSGIGGVIPEAVMTMPVIIPSGVIENRVDAYATYGRPQFSGGKHFGNDIRQPAGPVCILCSRFGYE